jgi:hypothetical protein
LISFRVGRCHRIPPYFIIIFRYRHGGSTTSWKTTFAPIYSIDSKWTIVDPISLSNSRLSSSKRDAISSV